MSRSQPTPAESLRITIALAALRFKPPEQPYHAYVLDLRTKFPEDQLRSSEQDIWRERALQLEESLKELQIKYDCEHIELVSLREAQPRQSSEAPVEPPASAGNKKKQKKKVPAHVSPVSSLKAKPLKFTLQTVLNGAGNAVSVPPGPSTKSLLSALETLDLWLAVHAANKAVLPAASLTAMVARAIDALGALFVSVVPPNHIISSSVGSLEALTTLVPRLLTAVLPLPDRGGRKRKTKSSENLAVLDDVLGRLTTAILVPLVRSFAPLSRFHLSTLLSPERNKQKRSQAHNRHEVIDIRAEVLALLKATIITLDELMTTTTLSAPSIHNLKHLLVLEVLRELQSLYPESYASPDGVQGAASTAWARPRLTERVERLIRKDTLWYLCNVLHLMFPTTPHTRSPAPVDLPDESDESHGLLEEAVYAGLSAFLRGTRPQAQRSDAEEGDRGPAASDGSAKAPWRGSVMGEVERGMLLAVVERVWLAM